MCGHRFRIGIMALRDGSQSRIAGVVPRIARLGGRAVDSVVAKFIDGFLPAGKKGSGVGLMGDDGGGGTGIGADTGWLDLR